MTREERILKKLTEQDGGLFYDTALRAMREFAKKDPLPPADGAESKTGQWKLISHSSQIADTGDYDGYYEITNGKISIYSRDDDDEALQPIINALNDSACNLYLDDATAVDNYILRHDIAELREELSRMKQPTAEGAELKDDKPCNKCTYNGHTTICEQCNDGNDYEHFTYNDPYSKESMNFFKVFIKARKDLCAISPTETYSLEEAIRKAFDGFFPQPTAEGAEENVIYHELIQPFRKVLQSVSLHGYDIIFAERDCVKIAEAFATLHAQRIADKMVSERLRGELIAMERYSGMTPKSAEIFVSEYIKTRESHE